MTRRAGLALLAAAALHFGVTRPLERQSLAAKDEYSRLRGNRREADLRLKVLERRIAEHARVSQILARAPVIPARQAVQEVRRRVVETLDAAGLSKVRLEVRPSPPPAMAAVTLQADADFFDAVRLLGALRQPSTGLVLDRVRLTSPLSGSVVLDIEATAIGAGS